MCIWYDVEDSDEQDVSLLQVVAVLTRLSRLLSASCSVEKSCHKKAAMLQFETHLYACLPGQPERQKSSQASPYGPHTQLHEGDSGGARKEPG